MATIKVMLFFDVTSKLNATPKSHNFPIIKYNFASEETKSP
jgi:hypothetical protein